MVTIGRLLRPVLDGLYLVSGILAGVLLVSIGLLMMVLSIGREIGFNLVGGDDLTAWLFAASAFLGLAHTFRKGELIRVGLLIERFQGRTRWAMELVALTVGSVIVCYFAWFSIRLVWDSWRFGEMSTSIIPVPMWIPQFSFAFGIAVLALAFLDELVHVALGNKPRYELPPPASAEEVVERAASSGV